MVTKADGWWLVAYGKSVSVPRKKSLNREGRKGYAKDAKKSTSHQLSAISKPLSAISHRPSAIRHWPCLFVPLTGAACAFTLKAKSKDKIPWP
jgi:hypothetical protein